MVEATAAGLPVVAYDLPVFREFLNNGEHSYLVPLNDHRPLADRLLKLLRNDLLQREISHRNAEYARQFTCERATEQEENALLWVLGERRGKPG
jgi:glycosyltransferase involved in cell wall biosynthesis